jgi:hypothetical protein
VLWKEKTFKIFGDLRVSQKTIIQELKVAYKMIWISYTLAQTSLKMIQGTITRGTHLLLIL